jgi:hypothetical protein
MAKDIFERLSAGRPQPAKKPTEGATKRPADPKLIARWMRAKKINAFLANILARGPIATVSIQRRGAEHGFTRMQLWRTKDQMGIVAFRKGMGANGRWFWTLPQNGPESVSAIKPRSRFTRRLRDLAKSRGYRIQPISKPANQTSRNAVGNFSKIS